MGIKYIRVEKTVAVMTPTGYNWNMHFAELQAFDTDGSNVALKKPSRASAELHRGFKEYANDGNTSGYWAENSVWHSAADSRGSWWEVDLGSEMTLNSVKIYNRIDPITINNITYTGYY